MAKGESPLKQFEIKPIMDLELFGYDISFTNSSLWMTITTLFIIISFTLPFLKSKKTNSVEDLYPSRMQVAAELGFNFISNLITCLLYTSPSPRDGLLSRMPSSA